MAQLLPRTTEEQVAQFQDELQATLNTGSAKDVEGAKCRCGEGPGATTSGLAAV
jgi:hypothetical protein